MRKIKNVAVIGSNGFIGTHLCKGLSKKGYNVIKCDLPDVDVTVLPTLDVLNSADIVFNLAAMPLSQCNRAPRSCINTNITGIINVLNAIERFKINRFIFASASSVYGDPATTPVREIDPKDPMTLYGCSKLAAENIIKIIMTNMDKNKEFKPSYGIFRFTNVYGPEQINGVIPTFIRKIKENETIEITGNGSQSRDFVYIDDVINTLINAIDTPPYNFVMNLGSGKQTTIKEIAYLIATILNKKARINYVMENKDRKSFSADLTLLHDTFGQIEFTKIQNGLSKTIKNGMIK